MSYHLNISNPACLTLGLNRGLDSGNPAADAHNLFEATDEDIFEAVMDVRGVQEADKTQVLEMQRMKDTKITSYFPPCE